MAGNTAPSEERMMQSLRIFSQGGLFEKCFENFQLTEHPNHDWLCEKNPNWELPEMVKVILDNLIPPMIHENWKEKGKMFLTQALFILLFRNFSCGCSNVIANQKRLRGLYNHGNRVNLDSFGGFYRWHKWSGTLQCWRTVPLFTVGWGTSQAPNCNWKIERKIPISISSPLIRRFYL